MNLSVSVLTILAIAITLSWSQDAPYPSLPSRVLSTYTAKTPAEYTPETMAATGNKFLSALTYKLRKQANLDYDSPEKGYWTNIPPRGLQGGIRLGDLNEKQLQLACDLLATVLSAQGYGKARHIPLADDELLDNGKRRAGFGAEDYWLAIFGKPSPTEPWALQFDGHHLAINLAFHGDGMSLSPTFVGTQPRTFLLADKTIEPMAKKDKLALTLMKSFSSNQQQLAIIGDRRSNLIVGAGRDGKIPKPVGLSGDTLTNEQTKKLIALIALYVGDLPKPYSDRRLNELNAQIKDMSFAWWGPVKENGDFSYRLQGPSLIIEYAGQNLGGDPSNHLHSMYRDPTNEYGKRLGE